LYGIDAICNSKPSTIIKMREYILSEFVIMHSVTCSGDFPNQTIFDEFHRPFIGVVLPRK